MTEQRIYGLDIFRTIAILLVVFFHGNYLLEPMFPGFPYMRLPDGVELFFVLSGFLIGGILIKLAENNWTGTSIFQFWIRRWFRTLPAYYLILLINIPVTYYCLNGNKIEFFSWKFFVFAQNLFTPFHSFFWESWSLAVEEWFYLILPLLFTLCWLLFRKTIKVKWIFLFSTLLLILLPLLFKYINCDDLKVDSFNFDILYRKTVIYRIDSIVYGVLFAWICFYLPGFWNKIKYPLFITGIAIVVYLLYFKSDFSPWFSKVWYFPLFSIGFAFMLPLAHAVKVYRGQIGKGITFISKISYSMYLIHLGLFASVIQFSVKEFTPWYGIFWFLIYIAGVISCSALLYFYFEKPMMDLRDKFRKQ